MITIKEYFERLDNVGCIFISLWDAKENKAIKTVQYFDRETLESEIGDYKIIEYSYGVIKEMPVVIFKVEL